MSIHDPVLIPKEHNLLIKPDFQPNPQVESRTLQLVAWVVSEKNLLQRDFLKVRSLLSQMQEDQVLSIIMNRPGKSEIAGAIDRVFIPFDVI